MESGAWIVIGALGLLAGVLFLKIYLLQRAAREIDKAFRERLAADTNILIDTFSHDPSMRSLADGINTGLRRLRRERHRFLQGDMELKDTITNVSHDLRTPLTAICGYLDLLQREEVSENARRYLAVIEERTEVLKQLTEELFRYSVTASADSSVPLEKVSLNRVLEDGISAYYAVLNGCRITPEISMPEQEIFRMLNKSALMRIMSNMLSNAVKYSDGDLKICLLENGEITFQNHASRLTEIEAGRLFDRFYTVETADCSAGLGLSIARILTEQMNGKIDGGLEDGILTIRLCFPGTLSGT